MFSDNPFWMFSFDRLLFALATLDWPEGGRERSGILHLLCSGLLLLFATFCGVLTWSESLDLSSVSSATWDLNNYKKDVLFLSNWLSFWINFEIWTIGGNRLTTLMVEEEEGGHNTPQSPWGDRAAAPPTY